MPAPIYTEGTFTRRGLALEEMTAPLGQAVGAMAEESWLRSPLSSLTSPAELYRQQYGDQPSADELLTGQFSTLDAPKPPTAPISAEVAREKAKGAGVKLDFQDGDIPEGYVDELIRRKTAENARKDALARAPGGFWAGAAVMGTGIGVSLLDPINVASAFVPVVGEARFAAMAGSIGLTGARLARGAAEGFVGAAMVEPIILGAAAAEQADYGMADSILNMTFGTVVGGGLHVGAGAIGDWLKKGGASILDTPAAPGIIPDRLASMSPEERGVVFRTALAQALDGRVVDVDPLIRPSARVEPGYAPPSTVSRAVTAGLETADAPIRLEVTPRIQSELAGETARESLSVLSGTDRQSEAIRAVNDWQRQNRSTWADELFGGSALSNPSFNAAHLVGGGDIQAHGMAKASPAQAIKDLISLFKDGIDPSRKFYTDRLTNDPGAGAGTGTAGGHAYRDGPFILVGHSGKAIKSIDDVAAILVNPALDDAITAIREAIPGVRVDSYTNVADVVREIKSRSVGAPSRPPRVSRNPVQAERMRQIEAAARQENPQVFTEIERVAAQRDAVAARLDEVKGRAAAEVTPEIAQASTQLREIDARLADLESQLSADGIDPRKAKKLTRQREEINAEREAAQTKLNEAQAKAGDTTQIADADKRIRELDREINDPGTGSRRAQELTAKRDKLIAERDAAIRAVSGEADLAGFDAARAMAGKDADELAAELKRLDTDLARKSKDAERVRRDIEQRMGGFYDIEQLKAIAERQSRPESIRLVDPKMADEVTARVADAQKAGADPVERAKVEADQAEELLRDLEARMGIEPEASVAGAVDPVAEAETITRAVQAMATCGLRR